MQEDQGFSLQDPHNKVKCCGMFWRDRDGKAPGASGQIASVKFQAYG